MKETTSAKYLIMGFLLWGFAKIAVGSMSKSAPFILTGCLLSGIGFVLLIIFALYYLLIPLGNIGKKLIR